MYLGPLALHVYLDTTFPLCPNASSSSFLFDHKIAPCLCRQKTHLMPKEEKWCAHVHNSNVLLLPSLSNIMAVTDCTSVFVFWPRRPINLFKKRKNCKYSYWTALYGVVQESPNSFFVQRTAVAKSYCSTPQQLLNNPLLFKLLWIGIWDSSKLMSSLIYPSELKIWHFKKIWFYESLCCTVTEIALQIWIRLL